MPTTLAPVRVRMRKIENGTSGFGVRSSIVTKAANRARASAIRPSVCSRAPAGVGGVDQRIDEDRERGGDGDRAGDVEGTGLGLGPALGDQPRRQHQGDQGDRDVDPEHPLPAEPVGEDAAEQHTGGSAGAGHGTPDPERLVALGAVAEDRGDDRERGGGDDRGAEALGGAGGDQLPLGRREAGRQRGDGDQQQAGHEDPAAAEQVGGTAPEQEEAAEGEHVGVDDPGQVLLGEVERVADRGQGDVDDRGVEDDDELGRAEQDQRQPAFRLEFRGGGHDWSRQSIRPAASALCPF